jgi:hypothetical protein
MGKRRIDASQKMCRQRLEEDAHPYWHSGELAFTRHKESFASGRIEDWQARSRDNG